VRRYFAPPRFCAQGRPYVRQVPRRIPRIVAAGFHHVTSRGNNRQPVFLDDGDREMFTAIFRRVLGRLWWACHSYCLMTNHFHLLVETQDESLSAGMQLLNGEYAQSFNRRHGSVGHLFQDRFFSAMVRDEAHGLEVIRYIAQNPVVAGLCRAAEDWPWSSHAAALGLCRPPDFLTTSWVLGQFGEHPEIARARLRAFVREEPPLRGPTP
jgi:putative transposase